MNCLVEIKLLPAPGLLKTVIDSVSNISPLTSSSVAGLCSTDKNSPPSKLMSVALNPVAVLNLI